MTFSYWIPILIALSVTAVFAFVRGATRKQPEYSGRFSFANLPNAVELPDFDLVCDDETEICHVLPKGWQGWEGGFNPLWFIYKSEDESVVVMQRNGYITPPMIASDLRWFHEGNDRDIVAWRVA